MLKRFQCVKSKGIDSIEYFSVFCFELFQVEFCCHIAFGKFLVSEIIEEKFYGHWSWVILKNLELFVVNWTRERKSHWFLSILHFGFFEALWNTCKAFNSWILCFNIKKSCDKQLEVFCIKICSGSMWVKIFIKNQFD